MHAFTIRDLARKDVKLLTQVLHKDRKDDESLRQLRELISVVPSQLRRSGLLNLISNRTHRFPAVAPACSLHKPLNGHVIRSIFNLVALEVGVRMNHLVARSERLSFEQRAILQSLRELHSMWLEPETYTSTFLQSPLAIWSYQEDKCEACMLARIGGNAEILRCLRTVVLSRTRTQKQRPPPRVARWVEEWIKRHEDLKEGIFNQSEEDGRVMKAAWKAAYKRRRKLGRDQDHPKEGNGMGRTDDNCELERNVTGRADGEDENEREAADNTGDDPYDFEHEIIDHYTALISSRYLPLSDLDDSISSQPTSSRSIDTDSPSRATQATTASTPASEGDEWEDVESVYWNPRQGPGWSEYFREQGSPKSLAENNHSRRSSSKAQIRGESEGIADGYRGALRRDSKRDSGSEYSREVWETGSRSSTSLAPTTWSMLYK